MTRCGFVAVLGAPNAGKSTLVNALVGEKVTIVSDKVQTTRMQVRGIRMHNDAQIVFRRYARHFHAEQTVRAGDGRQRLGPAGMRRTS